MPKDWARIDRPDLEIAPEQNADVIINFKPRRRSDSAPGHTPSRSPFTPKIIRDLKLKGTVHLTVLPYGGFGMALERNRLKPGERFRLHVHNQGSAPLPLNLIDPRPRRQPDLRDPQRAPDASRPVSAPCFRGRPSRASSAFSATRANTPST